MSNQSYDSAARKKSVRRGRERGCWVYIAADDLVSAGFDPHGPEPFYRVWAHARSRNAGAAIVSLYRER